MTSPQKFTSKVKTRLIYSCERKCETALLWWKANEVQTFIVAGEPVNIYTIFFLPTAALFTNHVAVPDTVVYIQKKKKKPQCIKTMFISNLRKPGVELCWCLLLQKTRLYKKNQTLKRDCSSCVTFALTAAVQQVSLPLSPGSEADGEMKLAAPTRMSEGSLQEDDTASRRMDENSWWQQLIATSSWRDSSERWVSRRELWM